MSNRNSKSDDLSSMIDVTTIMEERGLDLRDFEIDFVKIGQRLKEARKAKKIKQEEMAQMLFTTQSYISQIENGRRNASLEIILVYCMNCDVTPNDICKDVLVLEDKAVAELVSEMAFNRLSEMGKENVRDTIRRLVEYEDSVLGKH